MDVPRSGFSGISYTAGLPVASVASFPQSGLCLAMNRCFFSLFLGCLNGSLPPAVPEADLHGKLQNGHQSGAVHSGSDSRHPVRLKERWGRWPWLSSLPSKQKKSEVTEKTAAQSGSRDCGGQPGVSRNRPAGSPAPDAKPLNVGFLEMS